MSGTKMSGAKPSSAQTRAVPLCHVLPCSRCRGARKAPVPGQGLRVTRELSNQRGGNYKKTQPKSLGLSMASCFAAV